VWCRARRRCRRAPAGKASGLRLEVMSVKLVGVMGRSDPCAETQGRQVHLLFCAILRATIT
jgi:hypothetical protein